jgi:hypothetical protein
MMSHIILLLLTVYSVSTCFLLFSTEAFANQEQVSINSQIAVKPISTEEWRDYLGDFIRIKVLRTDDLVRLNELATEYSNQAGVAAKNFKPGSPVDDVLRLVIRAYSLTWYVSETQRNLQVGKWEEMSQSAKSLRGNMSIINNYSIDKSVSNLTEALKGSAFDVIQKKKSSDFSVSPNNRESAQVTTEDAKDKRTPLQKYHGAYTKVWYLCALTQKKVFMIEKARNSGISLGSDFEKDADVSVCIEKGLAEMKTEYNNFLPLVTITEGKKALQDHYVAAILNVKNTQPRYNEIESDYMDRINNAKRVTDELWVRFEITQP